MTRNDTEKRKQKTGASSGRRRAVEVSNVLLTGAFGNIGRHVIRELLRQNYRVRCFDVPTGANRKAADEFRGRVEVVWGDIRKADSVRHAVDGQDAVIHNAAIIPSTSEKMPEIAKAVNVGGTRNVVRAIQAAGRGGRTPFLVFPSSISVFGPSQHKPPPRRATDPVRATDHYTSHKIACERMIRAARIPHVILRVGAALDADALYGDIDSMKLMFEMSPDNRVEYVHPADVARAQVNALRCPRASGKILLIGGGPGCQIRQRDMFDAIFSALGLEGIPPEAFGDRNYYTDWMDTKESQRLLDFQRVTWADFRRSLDRNLGLYRWLLLPLRPLARQYLLSYSAPWQRHTAAR